MILVYSQCFGDAKNETGREVLVYNVQFKSKLYYWRN